MGVLRFLLAMSVLVAHSKYLFKFNILGGPLAVKAFFIISGFYMSLILNEKYVSKDSYKLFITNRFMRIYPIYAAVLILSILFFVFAYWVPPQNENFDMFFNNPINQYVAFSSKLDWYSMVAVIASNILIFFQDLIMFFSVDSTGNTFFTPNFKLTEVPMFVFIFIPQAWSVALECMYYLIAPFLVRKNLLFLILIIALTFVARFIVYSMGFTNDPWSYRFFPFELGYFLMGTISYFLYKRIPDQNLSTKTLWMLASIPLVMSLSYPIWRFNGSEYLYGLLFFMTLPYLFELTKNWKWDTYIGDLSYPIYMVHILVLFAMRYFSENSNKWMVGFIYLVSVIVFSILLNELVSKRMEGIRKRRYLDFVNKK
jgi:peptidoglycan/LPS O-acetylase OafA/YrhL